MKNKNITSSFEYIDSSHMEHHSVLLPKLEEILNDVETNLVKTKRMFDLGCGNGSIANYLNNKGWDVTGVDPSSDGIKQANLAFPQLKLYNGSTVDNLTDRFGNFPILISLEVIEHVYAPRDYMSNIYNLLEPGGVAIISTPYHGYLKNLLISLFGKMDSHFTALTDGGHIKFWSFKTLTQLLNEFNFKDIKFYRVGRFHPSIAKSMIVRFKKPIQ